MTTWSAVVLGVAIAVGPAAAAGLATATFAPAGPAAAWSPAPPDTALRSATARRPEGRSGAPAVAEQAGRVAALLELAAGEYALGVPAGGGRVTAAGEYGEARDFLRQAADLFAGLPADRRTPAAARLDSLRTLVERTAPPARVRALAGRVARDLATGWGAVLLPSPAARPSAARGAALYRADCAACHGARGLGDGPAGAHLDPPPADLAAADRAVRGTPSHDFQVVTLGVPGTRMKGWSDQLGVQERWDVVAYVQTLRFGGAQVAEGADLALGDSAGGSPVASELRGWSALPEAAGLSDLEMARQVQRRWSEGTGDTLPSGSAEAVVAYARALLGSPASGVPGAGRAEELGRRITEADSLVRVAAVRGASGDGDGARIAAVDAYMVFEGAETGLRSRAPGLTGRLEAAFGAYRDLVASAGSAGGPDGARIEAARAQLSELLGRARDELQSPVTAWSLATQSFFIILREGFEAILIIGAVLTFLARTGHARRRREVHLGVLAAVAASFLTAWALQEVLSVTPASQDTLEGATMLVAVVVLFWVSYWLLSKMEHDRWEAYLRGRMQRALGAGGGLALAGVAFLAVYREGFETVLFYKALLGFSGSSAAPVAGGFLVGCLALAAIYLAFHRFGVRIPMRPFFAVTSGVLYYMAIVFAGKGLHELQEAGVVASTHLSGAPHVELLGLYPTLETLAAQALLLGLLLGALWLTFGRGSDVDRAEEPGSVERERASAAVRGREREPDPVRRSDARADSVSR